MEYEALRTIIGTFLGITTILSIGFCVLGWVVIMLWKRIARQDIQIAELLGEIARLK